MNKKQLTALILFVVIFGMIGYQYVSAKFGAMLAAKFRNQPPVVEVSQVVENDIYPSSQSSGRLEAKYNVDIVARVSGYLQRSFFKEGAYVQKGQLLFQIEPDQFLIAMKKAQSDINNTKAQLKFAEKQYIRAKELVAKDYISKSAYDERLSSRDALRAQLQANIAAYNEAKRNYNYTRIKAPVSGKMGKILITQGNYVSEGSGAIATLVSTDPIYAYFNMKSQDYLKFKHNSDEAVDLNDVKVELKLADGSTYPQVGKVEFINNEVDPTSGTIGLRATFSNKNNELVANDYLDVVTTSIKPKKVILVPQIAVLDSSDGYYVWMINDKGVTEKRNIKISSQYNDKWIVLEGLNAGEQVISKGLLKLKPGIKVKIADPNAPQADNTKKKDKK